MKINLPILAGGVIVIGALVYVLAKGFGHDPHAVPFLLTGKPAPQFELPRIEGEGKVSLKSLAGRPTVLNFWSSWCVPCKSEHPVLEWGYEKLGKNVNFVGVVYQDSLPNVRDYLNRAPSAYTQLFDEPGRVAVDFGLAGVPETYFITADGMIQYKHIGPISRDELMMRTNQLMPVKQ